jgi:hypothetical protein
LWARIKARDFGKKAMSVIRCEDVEKIPAIFRRYAQAEQDRGFIARLLDE